MRLLPMDLGKAVHPLLMIASMALASCADAPVDEGPGRAAWTEHPELSMTADSLRAAVATERGRNALKVDCTTRLKADMPAIVRNEPVTSLGVKNSRVPWTVCDRLVEGVASDRISTEDVLATQQEPVDAATLNWLIGLDPPRPEVST